MQGSNDAGIPSWTPNLATREVNATRIDDIVFTPMSPVRRNQLITIGYQDLADAMACLIGRENASWCTYSQWPSSTVRTVLTLPIPGLREGVERAFGYGNRGVFLDIGQAYVTFLETVGSGARPRTMEELREAMQPGVARLSSVRRTPGRAGYANTVLQPGTLHHPGAAIDLGLPPRIDPLDLTEPSSTEPGPAPPSSRGAAPADLHAGLLCYGMSLLDDAEAHPSVRAQRIWAGNVYLAAHEQRWLDESLAAGFRIPIRRVLHPELNLLSQRDFRMAQIAGQRLNAEEWIIHLLTRHVVGFWLNGKWIQAGAALDPGAPPPDLDPIDTGTGIDPAAAMLVDRWPLTSSTRCWPSFTQRMGFIAKLFRIHQQDDFVHPIDDGRAAAILKAATRLVRTEPCLPQPPRVLLAPHELATLRHRGDPPADDAFAQVTRPFQGDHLVASLASLAPAAHAILPSLTDDGQARWTDLVTSRLIDHATIARAQHFYRTRGILINATLLFSSLPEGYAAAKGVRVLAKASRLGSTPVRRAGETTMFVLDVLKSGDFGDQRSIARQAITGVRGFHALVRWRVGNESWDTELLGTPVNQEDLLGTMLSFVVPVFESLDRVGVTVDTEDREAYTNLWCVIGYLLGLERHLVVMSDGRTERLLSYEDARLLAAQIWHRQRSRSVDGVRMLESLMEDIADNFPRALRHLPAVLLRTVGDPAVAEVLLAPPAENWLLNALVGVATRAASSPLVRPFLPPLLTRLSEKWLRVFVKEGYGRPYMDPNRALTDPVDSNIPAGCLDEAR